MDKCRFGHQVHELPKESLLRMLEHAEEHPDPEYQNSSHKHWTSVFRSGANQNMAGARSLR